MKKRKPPCVLFSALLVFVGVAVVFGGRLMKDVNHDEGHEIKERLAAAEREKANKPAEKTNEAESLVESVKAHSETTESSATPRPRQIPAAPGENLTAGRPQGPSTILVPKVLTGKAQKTDTNIVSLRYVNQDKKQKGKGN